MQGFKKQLVVNRSVIFHDKDEYYNLGQKDVDKFTKLSKIGFSMEWFTTDFLQRFTKKSQNLGFGWTGGYLPSNPNPF